MDEKKIEWSKPQLVILARGTSDENVLTHCKIIESPIAGAEGITQNGCNDLTSSNCGACQSRSGS